MSEKLNRLKEILGEVSDLNRASSVLGWDQQVNMPPGGAEARGLQLATLGKIAQEKFTADEVGILIEDLKKEFPDPQTDEGAMIRVTARTYDKAKRVPPEFVAEQAVAATKGVEAWVEAKQKSDFSIFRPHLEKHVELVKKYVSFFPPAAHPYDVLLDDFEPGLPTADVLEIFGSLRPKQVALIKAISEAKQVKSRFLNKSFNEKKVWNFSENIITKFGYDFKRGRQDKAPHPFETTFSMNDVRITNRFEKNAPLATLFSAMHECGHALYELGGNPAYERTPLAGGTSLAVHESQSRMWENLVGRSLPFWEHFYPQLKKTFPSQLEGVNVKTFYKAVNRVEPSLIRVNADEATYNLHIMLRLEIEIGMVDGSIQVRDLPGIWNAKMRDYLGITPPNDAQGVLQDIHWSYGAVGYFSTYALGNIVSAQLWEKINKEIKNLEEQIRKGQFAELREWLWVNIHQYGPKYAQADLVRTITGPGSAAAAYVRYLTKKYSDVYGL